MYHSGVKLRSHKKPAQSNASAAFRRVCEGPCRFNSGGRKKGGQQTCDSTGVVDVYKGRQSVFYLSHKNAYIVKNATSNRKKMYLIFFNVPSGNTTNLQCYKAVATSTKWLQSQWNLNGSTT